jgi:hypothetical protein
MQILEAVTMAGEAGVLSDDLFNILYDSDPEGGPLTGKSTLYQIVLHLNRRLQKVGKRVCAPKGGKGAPKRYRLVCARKDPYK